MTPTLTILLSIFEDAFFTWLLNNAPTLVCIGILLRFTWWIRGESIDYRNRFVKVELEVVRLDENQRSLEARMTSIEIRMTSIETRMTIVESKLDKLISMFSKKKANSRSLKGKSPLELTEIGTRILVDMGGKDYVDTHLTDLLRRIEESDPKSPLDVQNYSFILIVEKFHDRGLIPVRDYLYVNQEYTVSETESVDLDMQLAMNLISIYLRDRYFEVHPVNLPTAPATPY